MIDGCVNVCGFTHKRYAMRAIVKIYFQPLPKTSNRGALLISVLVMIVYQFLATPRLSIVFIKVNNN